MTTILMVGTYDTKADELNFLEKVIIGAGGKVYKMDVSVLGESSDHVDANKHDVVTLAESTIEEIIAYDDENLAFQKMAEGASRLTRQLYDEGKIEGMIALGGTMGTDLALDCAVALPLGVPKYIVSTVAFSPLIATERIASDVQMILWAGGLYGLNSLCKSTLAQAGGAVLGAAQTAIPPNPKKPMIGMTSLGKSVLRYMVQLLPALEQRGFEVVVFHSTGLGGRAFENLVAQGRFACVLDFCMQEFINGVCGSPVNSGPDRMMNAIQTGTPLMIAPAASDIIDFLAAAGPPPHLTGRDHHAHNRLIDSVMATDDERTEVAKRLGECLSSAKGAVQFFLPMQGMIEWDREGMPAHNPEGLKRFIHAIQEYVAPKVPVLELDCHINDKSFSDAVLAKFDEWIAEGIIQI